MAPLDLIASPSTAELYLPAVDLGPVKMTVGQIHCLLRGAEKAQVTREDTFQISARRKVPSYHLANGEKVILIGQKKATRPAGIDGVLFRHADGTLSWAAHRLVENMEKDAKAKGWPAVVAERAKAWDGQFTYKAEFVNSDGTVSLGNEGLRPPQLGALFAIGSHWSLYKSPATVVMPTGTGKTETMLATLAALIRDPLLVVVPSDALRSQTARKKFIPFGLLRKLSVLTDAAPNPIVGVVTKVPKTAGDLQIFQRCNVIVGTMDSLADALAEPLWADIAKAIGTLIIDEAHHVKATRWSLFREAFNENRVLQFTATPFRRDGQLVDGQVIYNYPLRMAQADGYFKPITFDPIYEPIQARADKSIAETAVAKLRSDIAAGHNHLMMARCSSIERARAMQKIYHELAPDLSPVLIHSELRDADALVRDLAEGRSRIAVCVNMLGEGFDLPELKVAAVHDLHKSLAILLQFTGRFTRSSGDRIGDATIIANIAEPNVSAALERLYSEDADWNELLSELSSDAAQDHAKLVKFLNEAQRLDTASDEDDTPISHTLLRPGVNTLVYQADAFTPKKFHEGLPKGLNPYRVWIHSPSNTLYFVTRSEPKVTWARSKAVRDREWALFVVHFDEHRKLLYISSSSKDGLFEELAKAVGGKTLIFGDSVFRAMGRINRLIFLGVGMKKHGRRNLSYASYTGAEVKSALGLAETTGSVKAMLTGIGWEGGKQITIGCSAKGRIWSRENATIPRLNEWCENIGAKLIDESIDTTKLIDHVLLPTVVTALPDVELLSIEWPVELLRQAEERVMFTRASGEVSQTTFDLAIDAMDRTMNSITFRLIEARTGVWGKFRFTLGGERFYRVEQETGEAVTVTIGKLKLPLAKYFNDYPPLFRFVDLTELDANLHIVPQNPYDLTLPADRFEGHDWTGVDITTESMWKDQAIRADSIQAHAAQLFIDGGFDVVFDDDSSGEAADLVCIKAEDDFIRVALVHCKFSGGATPGERVKDVVEVSAQAVRSARWVGKFVQLTQHLKARNEALKEGGRPTRFLKGTPADLTRLVKFHRFRPIRAEIIIVQPGLSIGGKTPAQEIVLAAAATYLKETVSIDLAIMCSD